MSKKDKRNYIKLGLILVFTIVLAIIIKNLYTSYDNNKANRSYISKYVSSINCKDLSNAMLELSGKNYLYLSYTGNKNIFELEKRIRKVLRQNDLEDNFIYVDCTNDVNEDNHVSNLKDLLIVGKKEITLPAIIYFNDLKPIDYIDSQNGLIDSADFVQLLDQYEVSN